jgi:hypothetical protein
MTTGFRLERCRMGNRTRASMIVPTVEPPSAVPATFDQSASVLTETEDSLSDWDVRSGADEDRGRDPAFT